MSISYVVTATQLNVRRQPVIQPGNVIGRLGQGARVEGLGDSGEWVEIRAEGLQGFAASRFLLPTSAAAPPSTRPATFKPPQVNFPPNSEASLSSTSKRHCPLGSPSPRQSLSIDAVHQIVVDLNVTGSARYRPTLQTFCNIYAYDFCYLAGVYLPRVWWTSKALVSLASGENLGVVYDKTVRELNANDLHRWLTDWGDGFGWKPCQSVHELQSRVNQEGIGLITAQRVDLNKSGHIVMVLPENSGHTALRSAGEIVAPLQSQAGRVNKAYFANRWWIESATQYRAVGFWSHA